MHGEHSSLTLRQIQRELVDFSHEGHERPFTGSKRSDTFAVPLFPIKGQSRTRGSIGIFTPCSFAKLMARA